MENNVLTSQKTMTISVEAIYERGVLRPLWPLDLAEGTKIAVLIVEPITAKLEAMREVMNDPLFLADLEEVAEDFKSDIPAEPDHKPSNPLCGK